ncbi:MAG: hypothetical protein IJN63_01045 [Clostridia bacterium]|nr:hypothetical protein [Clostridia bacterium]
MLKKILSIALACLMLCAMPLTVSAADTEFVVYENDFSDPATLAEFKQFRAKWEIKDGKLWVAAPADDITDPDTFAFLILNKDVTWKNYMVEADIENVQTSTGIVCHVNNSLADASTANSFAGYLGFLSNDATKGAMGRSNPSDHTAWGGNYSSSVFSAGTAPGSSVHMEILVTPDTFTLTIYDLETSTELYTYTEITNEWPEGTVGFRARLNNTGAGTTSLNTVSFDNLKVTLLGEEADAAKAAASAPVVTTEAPVVTTEAPVVTTAAPVVTTEAPAQAEPTPPTGDASVMAVFAAAAAICLAAVVVIKKREN